MLAVGSLDCGLGVVTIAGDTKATEGAVVGSGVVFEGGVDLSVVLTTGWSTWRVGPCAWGCVAGVGLAMVSLVMYSEGLGVLMGLLVFAVVATV